LDNNLNIKPEFTNPGNNDYSLNWNSPCIESGKADTTGLNLPPTDLNGDPRIVNARVDMGAYEYQLPVSILRPKLPFSDIQIIHNKQNSTIIIEFPDNLTDKVLFTRIIKMDGTEVMNETKSPGFKSVSISIPGISPGIYLVVVIDNEKLFYSNKVLISR
jgi:hypothetical protein